MTSVEVLSRKEIKDICKFWIEKENKYIIKEVERLRERVVELERRVIK